VRSLDYEDVEDDLHTVQVSTTNQGIESTLDYSVQTQVSEPQTDLKRVRVLVSWAADRARHVEVLTDVARLR
jgi:hypothetical protein